MCNLVIINFVKPFIQGCKLVICEGIITSTVSISFQIQICVVIDIISGPVFELFAQKEIISITFFQNTKDACHLPFILTSIESSSPCVFKAMRSFRLYLFMILGERKLEISISRKVDNQVKNNSALFWKSNQPSSGNLHFLVKRLCDKNLQILRK